jgi:hypothetical protein
MGRVVTGRRPPPVMRGGLKNNMALSAEVWSVTPISRDLLYIPMAPDLG